MASPFARVLCVTSCSPLTRQPTRGPTKQMQSDPFTSYHFRCSLIYSVYFVLGLVLLRMERLITSRTRPVCRGIGLCVIKLSIGFVTTPGFYYCSVLFLCCSSIQLISFFQLPLVLGPESVAWFYAL